MADFSLTSITRGDLERAAREYDDLGRPAFLSKWIAPEIRWLPVLQGRSIADYLRHIDMYKKAGINLRLMARVGVGSVCRLQATHEIVEIATALSDQGLNLHGFGVKSEGLRKTVGRWKSTDSQSWSFDGRRLWNKGFAGHDGKNLANSQPYAEAFRAHMQALLRGEDSQRVDYELSRRVG